MFSLRPNFFIFGHRLNKGWLVKLVSKGFHFQLQARQGKWLVQLATKVFFFQSLIRQWVTCLNKYSPSIFSMWQMISKCVSYDVNKYVIINYKLNNSSKNRWIFIFASMSAYASRSTQNPTCSDWRWCDKPTQKWNIMSILTTLLNMTTYSDLGEGGHVYLIINF
jgi:hypothetical protein